MACNVHWLLPACCLLLRGIMPLCVPCFSRSAKIVRSGGCIFTSLLYYTQFGPFLSVLFPALSIRPATHIKGSEIKQAMTSKYEISPNKKEEQKFLPSFVVATISPHTSIFILLLFGLDCSVIKVSTHLMIGSNSS